MSYLRALETARSHLDRGDLLAAEAAYDLAHEDWRRSRVRAPLVERGLEPALRRVVGWFGRTTTRPVLPVFGHLASVLEDDLRALAGLLHDEVRAVLDRGPEDLVEADRVVLENGLRLDRESRWFALSRVERWQTTRRYLESCRRLARRVEVGLLPEDLAASEDEHWFRRWAEAILAGGGASSPELFAWMEGRAVALGRLDTPTAAGWNWVTARAALRDPEGGERALVGVQRAIEGGLDPEDDRVARRTLAGLLVNESLLAGPGADVEEALERWRPGDASTWPPSEIAELLTRRRDVRGERATVAAAWDDEGHHVVLVLHDGALARDALAFAPRRDGGDRATRFEASLPEARGWIQRWVPEGALVLLPGEPPTHVADLLAGHERLDVGALFEAIPVASSAPEPVRTAAAHPLWSTSSAHPVFRPLADRARDILPRFRAWAEGCPAFSEAWGRTALTVMAEHGLDTCGTLRVALDRTLDVRDDVDRALQVVDLVVPLHWPRLEARDWPATPSDEPSSERSIDRGREGCLWFARGVDLDELVSISAASERAQVLTVESARAAALAGRVAFRVDARRVTVAPSRVPCPDAWLQELDAWMQDAIGDTARQLDVLWLWRLLAETPNGEVRVDAAADDASRSRIAALADRTVAGCGDTCRLTRHGGCWGAQLEGRQEVSRVWIVPRAQTEMTLDEVDDLLVDDLRRFVTDASDPEAASRLGTVLHASTTARRAWIFARSGRLDAALRAAWTERVDRPLHHGGEASGEAAALLLVPPGYRPGDPLLADEGTRLIEIRAEAWSREPSTVLARWEAQGSQDVLSSPAMVPSVDHVVTARLADDATDDRLILLLRAAAAQSHARKGWSCLDPRLAFRLDHAGGPYPDVDAGLDAWSGDLAEAARLAVAEGAALLAERGGRSVAHWNHPITADRLRTVAEAAALETDELADALRDWGRGRPLVLGGASDRQRAAVIALLRELAVRSADGGPLGVRCVLCVGSGESADSTADVVLRSSDAGRLGAVMLEADRGRISRVDLDPALLRDEALRAWARRASSVAWVFPRLDRLVGGEREAPAGVLSTWREILERSGAAALGFVDAVDDSARGPVARRAAALDARRAALAAARRRDAAWSVTVETVGPAVVACWQCTRSVEVHDAAARCPSCEAPMADHPGTMRAATATIEDALVSRLHARAPGPWWAITADRDLAARMRQRLGLNTLGVDQAPLLAAVAAEPDDPRVLHVDDLEGMSRPPADLLWLDVPEDAREVQRVLQRLAAMESRARQLTLLLPPLGLRMTTSYALRGPWRWDAKRTEVEFRLREIEGGIGRGFESIGLRPAPAGPDLRGPLVVQREVLFGEHTTRPTASVLVGAIESAGVSFGAGAPAPLDVTRLPETVDDADLVSFLTWAVAVGVMEGPAPKSLVFHSGSMDLERRLRGLADGGAPAADVLTGRGDVPDTVELEPFEGALRAGIARATDAWFAEAIENSLRRGERTIVVVARPTGRERWTRRLGSGAEIVDVQELALAVLDAVARERGVQGRARTLPAAGSAEGEEIRIRLMRDTSRRYAKSTGRIPSLEAHDLRRAVQGEMREIPMAATVDVDLDRLDRCAAEARAAAGWLTTLELREASTRAISADPALVERWRTRYPRLAIDGIHDLSDDLLAFLRALYPTAQRFETVDPLLAPDPTSLGDVRQALETDLPRDTVRAIEVLRRHEPDDLGRLRARGRQRARDGIERVRVLTLRAAADWLVENVDPEREPDRTGVVVAHEDDRQEIAAALRRGGLAVLESDALVGLLADGPRHALAALHLVHGEPRAEVLDVLAALDPATADVPSDARFARWMAAGDGDPRAPLDAAELRLARLHVLRGRLPGSTRVVDAVRALATEAVFDPLLAADAASGRLRDWIADHGHRTIEEVLPRVDVDLVADPAASHRALRVLGHDDLVGVDFDHLITIGTGFEPSRRHVRVLLRAPQRVTILYSERDPLA